jgi:hypothetical protein
MVKRNLHSSVNKQQAAALLQQLAQEHLLNNTNSIVNSKDCLQAFGCYTVSLKHNLYHIYKNRVLVETVCSRKSALCWCIADKYKIEALANSIKNYDQDLDRKNSEIAHYKNVLHADVSTERKSVIADRLFESVLKAKHIHKQLDKCVNQAKYWQQKGFNNETARLGIKPSDRKFAEGI